MSLMKLSVTEKIGFGAGDMAVNIVMITMQLIIAFSIPTYTAWTRSIWVFCLS